ncbi:MAG: paraquat-inducible protein A [Chthoniobacterales bacterium]
MSPTEFGAGEISVDAAALQKEKMRLDVQRITALIVAGGIMYLPANVFPVMLITVTGKVDSLTVFGGVEEFYGVGLWPAAIVIFFASIVVPFLKLAAMGWILLLHGSERHRLARTRLLRALKAVGTWSMIDIFLLSVLTAVGQLGILASVEAKMGALFFAAVFLCSIVATDLYKAEYIWISEPDEKQA